MSEFQFPEPSDYDAQHQWVGWMLLRFRRNLAEVGIVGPLVETLTLAYFDKLLPDASPPISPDLAQAYERMSSFFTEVTAREREE